jgi:hypothetical protein
LYATTTAASANRLIKIIDSGAAAVYSDLAIAPTNTAFRGVEFVASAAAGLAGDYNNDTVVNQADYDLWKSSFGTAGGLQNETASLGIADAADYTVWRDNLGAMPAGAGSLSAVPEPTSFVLVLVGLAGLTLGRRRLAG